MKAIALALSLLGASVAVAPSPPPAHPVGAYPFAVGEEFEFSVFFADPLTPAGKTYHTDDIFWKD